MYAWPLSHIAIALEKLKAPTVCLSTVFVCLSTVLARLAITVAVIMTCTPEPAAATSASPYKKDEYPIISHGLAPNKQVSIAAHGEGEDGSDNFHVYVMEEPEHKRKAILAGVGANDMLDSSPTAYEAIWSEDSRYVAISYRRNRHLRVVRLYYIHRGQARQLKEPELLQAATHRSLNALGQYASLIAGDTALTWTSPTRFSLSETRLFRSASPELARVLGKYGNVTDSDKERGVYTVEFSASAVCELVAHGQYRVIRIAPGKFREP
jgi:hypothetical protein